MRIARIALGTGAVADELATLRLLLPVGRSDCGSEILVAGTELVLTNVVD